MVRSILTILLFSSCIKTGNTQFADYYIIAGQSNCGRPWFPGNGKNGPMLSEEDAAKYGQSLSQFKIYNYRYDIGAFHPLQAGINTMLYNPAASEEFGPEVSLFTTLNKPGYLTKFGYGNTDLETDWMHGKICDNLLKEQVTTSIRLIKTDDKTPVLRAFIWIQGENDAVDSAYSAHYYSNLVAFFSDFDSWYHASIPYQKIIARVAAVNDVTGVVRAAQERYCRENNATLINTDSLEMYGVHYDANGQIQFGLDILKKLNQ